MLAFFARIKHAMELNISLLKTIVFLNFQMLHKRKGIFWSIFGLTESFTYLSIKIYPNKQQLKHQLEATSAYPLDPIFF